MKRELLRLPGAGDVRASKRAGVKAGPLHFHQNIRCQYFAITGALL
jgi:hypothetical protein